MGRKRQNETFTIKAGGKMVRVAVLCGGMRVCQFGIPADETIEAETGWGFVKLSISEVG